MTLNSSLTDLLVNAINHAERVLESAKLGSSLCRIVGPPSLI